MLISFGPVKSIDLYPNTMLKGMTGSLPMIGSQGVERGEIQVNYHQILPPLYANPESHCPCTDHCSVETATKQFQFPCRSLLQSQECRIKTLVEMVC